MNRRYTAQLKIKYIQIKVFTRFFSLTEQEKPQTDHTKVDKVWRKILSYLAGSTT